MERLNLCKEVLENAIGVHRNLEKIEPLAPLDAVAVQAMEELLKYRDAEEQCIKECGCNLRIVIEKYKEFLEHIQELAEYWKLEEQGLILRLPCKVGDTLYYLYNEHILKDKVETIKIRETHNRDGIIITIKTVADDYFYIENFGKTVFLTQEEAEQALEKMKGE